MFDLSRIAEAVGSLLRNNVAEALPAGNLIDAISNAGIDISSLQGLAPQEIIDLLGRSGIDITSLTPESVQQVLNAIGCEGGAASLLGSVFSRER